MSKLSVSTALRTLAGHRELISQFVVRDVTGRYRGSFFGIGWSFLNPILLLVVYTFLFGVVFRATWLGAAEGSTLQFAIILFAGMLTYNFFSECVNRAPSMVVSNPNYVKKVVFPLEILPGVALGSALFHYLIGVFVLLIVQLLVTGSLPWTIVLLPCILVPLVFLTAGAAWLLAALGVYVRDVGQATATATIMLGFLSPVFYPLEAVPEAYRELMRLNPLTSIVEGARDVLVFGALPNWGGLLYATILGVGLFLVALAFFQRARVGFADVL